MPGPTPIETIQQEAQAAAQRFTDVNEACPYPFSTDEGWAFRAAFIAARTDQALTGATIDTADHVLHGPTGETWVVAYVHGDRLCACGWPESLAPVTDCKLTLKATPAERLRLLRSMAAGDGSRARYAQEQLAGAAA